MDPLLLTPQEAAKYLSIGKTKLYELKSKNRIKYVKIGKSLRFRKIDLEEFIDKQIAKSLREFQRREFKSL
jgi:excisionase family DNA binding protein